VILGHCACKVSGYPPRSGNLNESEAVDALGMRDYSWRHSRGNYVKESRFDLGNPGTNSLHPVTPLPCWSTWLGQGFQEEIAVEDILRPDNWQISAKRKNYIGEEIVMAEYAHPEALVDTQWVADYGDDAILRLVEVDVDTSAYEQGHIAGAVGWNWQSQLQQSVRRDIVSKEEMEQLLRTSGINNNTTVILYGDNNNWFACWAFWQLKYYGHDNVKVMNGGRAKWVAENRPLTTEAPNITTEPYRASEPDESVRAYRDQVLEAIKAGNVALVDVRSPLEYSGELLAPPNLPQEGSQRGGHIPGAANIPWAQAVNENGTFKSADELIALYGGKSIDGSKETIAYCRIGERSSHTWFVLTQLLGYDNARNYDGSWTEWGSIVGAPIEK
jgi:thiosulfate/3-mercaptopyruvate sulfurtransferase